MMMMMMILSSNSLPCGYIQSEGHQLRDYVIEREMRAKSKVPATGRPLASDLLIKQCDKIQTD